MLKIAISNRTGRLRPVTDAAPLRAGEALVDVNDACTNPIHDHIGAGHGRVCMACGTPVHFDRLVGDNVHDVKIECNSAWQPANGSMCIERA